MIRSGMFIGGVAVALATAAVAQDATIGVAESEPFGQYLVGPDGMPVYMFTTDTQGNGGDPAVSCSDACLDAWPLVQVTGEATAGEGADAAMLGTFEHEGMTVATYDGWPLYTFARDTVDMPPQGNEIESFGGEWYLLSPQGEQIEGE